MIIQPQFQKSSSPLLLAAIHKCLESKETDFWTSWGRMLSYIGPSIVAPQHSWVFFAVFSIS